MSIDSELNSCVGTADLVRVTPITQSAASGQSNASHGMRIVRGESMEIFAYVHALLRLVP